MRIFTRLLSCLIALNATQGWGADASAKFDQCAMDLCGPSSNYARIMARGNFANANEESKTFIAKNLNPDLDKAFKLALRTKSNVFALADKYFQKENVPITDEQRAVLTVITYMGFVPKFDEMLTSTDGRIFQVDATKLRAKMSTLSDARLNSITQVLNTLLAHEDFGSSIAIEGYSYDNLMNSWGAQAVAYTLSIRSTTEKIFSAFGPAMKVMINTDVLDKAVRDPASLSESEKKNFISVVATIYRVSAMISDPVVAAAKTSGLTLAEAAKMLNWSTKLARIKSTLASDDKTSEIKAEVRKQCHDIWSQSLAAVPSRLRQRKTIELLNLVKDSSKRVTPKYFTGSALKQVNKSVDEMTFSKPADDKETKTVLTGSFKLYLESAEREQHDLSSSSDSDGVAYAIMSLANAIKENVGVFDSILDQCKKMAPRPFNDAAYSNLNSIMTSWQSTMFPEIGAGVIAHEIGHIVSYASDSSTDTDKTSYTDARTCSLQKHAQLAQETNVQKFSQYAEEDWADVFAAAVLLDLKKTWPYAENYACALIGLNEKEKSYSDLILWDSRGVDTHSPSFLRALQLHAALKRPMPASCTQAMTAQENTIVGRSCVK